MLLICRRVCLFLQKPDTGISGSVALFGAMYAIDGHNAPVADDDAGFETFFLCILKCDTSHFIEFQANASTFENSA